MKIIRRFSRKSLINLSKKSYVNFKMEKGNIIRGFWDSGISLISFSEKSYMNERREDLKDFPY